MDEPQPPKQDEYVETERDRRIANIVLLVILVVIVGAGIWLANAMVNQRVLDDCLAQGGRKCTPPIGGASAVTRYVITIRHPHSSAAAPRMAPRARKADDPDDDEDMIADERSRDADKRTGRHQAVLAGHLARASPGRRTDRTAGRRRCR